jgi:four helix bundle protein
MSSKPFNIRERSYLFGRDVFAFTRRNLGSGDFVVRRLAVQLIDAAGSVGANLEEAGDGQSKADFISKNCIALKEIREANSGCDNFEMPTRNASTLQPHRLFRKPKS